MKNIFIRVGVAFAAIATFVLTGAAKCEGPQAPSDTHLILDVSRPPLAQTLGCPDGKWYIRVVDRKVADDKNLSPDQKAARAKTVCESPNVAEKYSVGGYWP